MTIPEISRIGLLVVHGVGNQPPGRHCALVGEALKSVDGSDRPNVNAAVEDNIAALRTRYSGGPVPPYPVEVSGVPVRVVEAYWAPLSRLENAPEVDWHRELWGRLWETMCRVWREPQILRDQPKDFAQLSWGQKVLRLAVYTLMLAPVIVLGLSAVVPEMSPGMDDRSRSAVTPVAETITMILGMILGASWWICCAFSAREAWGKFRARQESQGASFGLMSGMLYAMGLAIWVVLRPSVIMMTGYIPLVTFGLLGVGVVLVAWGQTAVAPFRVLNRWLAGRGWERLRHSFNRIGWSSIVLFPKVGLESIKSVGHLLEVMIVHPSIRVRSQALWALGKVYVVTLFLLVFSYVFFFLPLNMVLEGVKWFLGPEWGFAHQDDIFDLEIGFAGLYLILIWLTGGMLDFILDVANYHLADKEDRRRYWHKLDEAANQLAACREIGCVPISVEIGFSRHLT